MSNLMEIQLWQNVKHFKPTENWGSWRNIQAELIYMLDAFRDKISTPIYISCGTQGEHSPNSFHYQGLAVDVLFLEKEKKDLPELAQAAEDEGFTGIGIYTSWRYKKNTLGGMHLDIRAGKVKRWIGTPEMYLPFNAINIKRYF